MMKHENELFLTPPGDTCSLPLEVALLKLVCKPPRSKYVVEMLEWFETPTSFILVLERPVPCINLYMYCGGYYNRCLPESQAKIIMEQVVLAVCHCHDRGVFHRDIKEENIILNPDTLDVKLIDFGCGDLIKNSPYTEFAGTPLFVPPEWYFDNEYSAEPATVWGLGILLYSLLCGEPPYIDFFSITEGYYYLPESLPESCMNMLPMILTHFTSQSCLIHPDVPLLVEMIIT